MERVPSTTEGLTESLEEPLGACYHTNIQKAASL
jgi:hypothetical protein